MTENELKNIQVQTLLNRAVAADIEIYDSLRGQRVVLEESELGCKISIGTLTNHGEELAVFEGYSKYHINLREAIIEIRLGKKIEPDYRIPIKKIKKSQIASIQSLEGVLQGKKFESIFGGQ